MSSPLKLTNNSIGRLAGNVSNAATSFSLQPGEGAKFPAVAAGEFFPITVVRASDNAIEIMKVTGRAADTLTVERSRENTAAIAFLAGDRVELRLTAGTLQDEIARVEGKADTAQTDATQALADAAAAQADVDALDAAALKKAGGTMTGLLTFKNGSDIESASTVDLTSATGNTVHITGTTAITAWTMTAGQVMDIIFDGVLTLTYDVDTNNLPAGNNITTAAGDRARYFYDGTKVYCLSYDRANGAPVTERIVIAGASKNLVITNNASAPNSKLDVDAYEIILKDASGNSYLASSVNLTLDMAVSGVGGLRSGLTEANSTWYYPYIGFDGTDIVGWFDDSATSPTVPSGILFWVQPGDGSAIYNDPTGNFIKYYQFGKEFRIGSAVVSSSLPGTSYVSVSLAAVIPPLAKFVMGRWACDTGPSADQDLYISPKASDDLADVARLFSGSQTRYQAPVMFDVPLIEPQTFYVKRAGDAITAASIITVTGGRY